METNFTRPFGLKGIVLLLACVFSSITGYSQTYDSITVNHKIHLGQSIIFEGLSSQFPYNHIYTDPTSPTDLLLQCPQSNNFNTIINWRNNGLVGIGLLKPEAKLHLHTDELTRPNNEESMMQLGGDPILNSSMSLFDLPLDSSQVQATGYSAPAGDPNGSVGFSQFLMTNVTSGATINDGLLFQTTGEDGSITLQEKGNFVLRSYGGLYANANSGPLSLTAATGNIVMAGDNLIFRTNATGAPRMYITSAGNIGIGTTTPSQKLEVIGNTHVSGKVEIGNSIWLGGANQFTANNDLFTDDADLQINCNPAYNYNTVLNANNGKVQIGSLKITSGPHTNYKLSVDGKVVAKEIYVTLTGWADYVFANDYKLMPLNEVEQFIEQNNHLPNVPSEKEVISNGNNLGEMDAILLRKVEELTLYMIDIKKENDELKKKVEELQSKGN